MTHIRPFPIHQLTAAFLVALSLVTGLTLSAPVLAMECANAGAAPAILPDDTGDPSATACGEEAVAGGTESTALGYRANAPGIWATALGWGATAEGESGVALGDSAWATGNGSPALGFQAAASGDESAAVGWTANATGIWATALGWAATAEGASGVALGDSSNAVGDNDSAIGPFSYANGNASTALGPGASASGAGSAALGTLAYVSQDWSVVLGAIRWDEYEIPYANVGIGTPAPMAPLHIFRDDATRELLLLDSNEVGVTQDRPMIQLINNGGIRFQFDNVVQGTAWRFQAATGNQDNFEITKVGTGKIEFKVDADGNAYLAGLLFESSDRNAKTNIHPVDPEAILEKVTQMPISQWAYKEAPDSHHIGPMAQDFRAAFETGRSDTTLATMDTSGVALASIQALETRSRKLATENEALLKEVTLLKQEMQELKGLLLRLSPPVALNH